MLKQKKNNLSPKIYPLFRVKRARVRSIFGCSAIPRDKRIIKMAASKQVNLAKVERKDCGFFCRWVGVDTRSEQNTNKKRKHIFFLFLHNKYEGNARERKREREIKEDEIITKR